MYFAGGMFLTVAEVSTPFAGAFASVLVLAVDTLASVFALVLLAKVWCYKQKTIGHCFYRKKGTHAYQRIEGRPTLEDICSRISPHQAH